MFDMTFPTPESLNKYRDDDNKIDQKILHDEEINKQLKIYLKWLIKLK